jgi:uncharacterized membrane protein
VPKISALVLSRKRFPAKLESFVAQRKANTERLGFFSDAVFAVIITIMVLELKPPPEDPSFGALLPIWPTALSYLVSYYFIAIVWVNHHHLLRLCQEASPRLIWINFAHLFMVSLVPFSTAWIADTKLAAVPVFVYAGVFVLVNLAYIPFEWHALGSASAEEIPVRTRQFAKRRSLLTLGTFAVAMLVSLKFPWLGFALICCALLVYLCPEPFGVGNEGTSKADSRAEEPLRGERDAGPDFALGL